VACLALKYIPHISALWSVWLYIIFHISAHCGLSVCTMYSTYQRTMFCLALHNILNISALWPVWLYNILCIITQSALFSRKFIKRNVYILIFCIILSMNFLILRSILTELIKTEYRYSSNLVIILVKYFGYVNIPKNFS
jgi:hypothetical protein